MKKYLYVVIALIAVVVAVSLVRRSSDNPATPVSYKGSYVALGDSVAAGVGIGDYTDASACNRTNKSYPVQYAQSQSLKLTSLACSGATLTAGILGK